MDDTPLHRPLVVTELRSAAEQIDFTMSCDERTGCLLATLAAARPGGRLLELGTGAGGNHLAVERDAYRCPTGHRRE